MPKSHTTFEDYLNPVVKLFEKVGISWILVDLKPHKISVINSVLIVTALLNSAYSDVLAFFVLANPNIEFAKKIELSACCLTNLLAVLKVTSLFTKRKKIALVLNTIHKEWPCFEGKVEQEGYSVIIKPILRVITLYSWVVFFAPFLFGLIPIYDRIASSEWSLPFEMFYPFDWKASTVGYAFCYLQQVHVGFITAYSMTSPDCLLLIFIGSSALHMRTLARNLEDATSNTEKIETVRKKLKEIYKRHIQLLRYIELVQDVYSDILTGLFIINSFIICIVMFAVTTMTSMAYLPKYLMFASAVLMQTLLICWFGDQLTEQAHNVGYGAYHTNWHTLPPGIRRDLAFVIARANKPVRLRGGPIAHASLSTFTSILSSSWTYFNLMRMLFGN